MESALRAALKHGIPEREFWLSTPYRVSMLMKEAGTARIETALYTGWFAERFAREERLQPAQHYVTEMLGPAASEEVQLAMAEAELTRMAGAWGLDLEDIVPEE